MQLQFAIHESADMPLRMVIAADKPLRNDQSHVCFVDEHPQRLCVAKLKNDTLALPIHCCYTVSSVAST